MLKSPRQNRQERRRGSALMGSLIVVLVVAALGAALVQQQSSLTRRQVQAIDQKRALYVAEAGLAEALLAIRQGKSGNVGSEDKPAAWGDGVYWVEATEDEHSQLLLESVGLCGVGRFAINLVVERDHNPIGSLGLFADRHVTVEAGALIDGYDSTRGLFEEQVDISLDGETTGGGALVGSNRDVYLEAYLEDGGDLRADSESTRVLGDLVPGPSGEVYADPGVELGGSIVPAERMVTFGSVQVPVLEEQGDLFVDSRTTGALTLDGSRQYGELTVGNDGQLVLRGPAAISIGQFTVMGGGQLHIDTTDGPVELYCTELLKLGHAAVLSSETRDPTQFSILIAALSTIDRNGDGVPDPPIKIASSGELYGLIYAPHNDIAIPESLRVFGSIVASSLRLEEGARLTYDQALSRGGIGVETVPGLLSWRIAPLPDAAIVKRRIDPLSQLQLSGITPVPSPQAHLEQHIDIDYMGLDLLVHHYSGPESGLDWSNVLSVVTLQWTP